VDCRGGVYVTEEGESPKSFARVERFGDVAAPPPCVQEKEKVKVELRPHRPTRRLKFRIKLHPKRGTATVFVNVTPLGGQLYLRGRGIRPAARKARRHGCLKRRVRGRGPFCSGRLIPMPVRPSATARQALETGGEAKVRMILTYTPPEGDPATKRKTFTLRKTLGTGR
jgi:hypothetical protein